jgi:hypothetical protein
MSYSIPEPSLCNGLYVALLWVLLIASLLRGPVSTDDRPGSRPGVNQRPRVLSHCLNL